ncbi:MAG: sugar phosphate isomerase/epimerase family protein, partial [Armatimonadota bacterium]
MHLSFMTWVCPEWELPEVLTAALRYGYDAVEPRAEADHAHGVEIDTTKKERASIRAAFEDLGIEMSCIATSRRYALVDQKERAESIDITKRYVTVAQDLGCRHIRVFGGMTPEGMSFEDAKKHVAESLREAATEAEGTDVYLCIETHDAYCLADDLMEVVEMADHEHVAVCWDIMHPVTHGMSMADAFEHVKGYVRHCHIHDGIRPDDPDETHWDMYATGEGDIPNDEAV